MRIPIERAKEIAEKTGCYFLENSERKIIYIGKAKNIKKRIFSHLLSKKIFLDQVKFLNFIITDNEKEALILEQNLIKKYLPKFNILLKDDRYYPYLEITNEEDPKYKIIYKVNEKNKANIFGPFPDGSKAREMMKILEKFFPLAKCEKKNKKNPCFYYEMKMCSGSCFKEVKKNYYLEIKKKVRDFFQGNTNKIKKTLKENINKNIKNLAFELAKKEKKILESIDFFTKKQNIEFNNRESNDFLGVFFKNNIISFYLLIYRYGILVNTNESLFSLWDKNLYNDSIESYIYQFYQNNSKPDNFYISGELDNNSINSVKLISNKFGFKYKIPKSGNKKKILELAKKNSEENWKNHNLENFGRINNKEILTEISRVLSINFIPDKIEFIDISNIFNQDITAGFLSVINAQKNIQKSKIYEIKSEEIKGKSDGIRMEYACMKHYKNYNQKTMPNLIIVDGGREQINSSMKSLKKLNLKSEIIGLTKNKKHVTEKIIFKNKELKINEISSSLKNFLSKKQEDVHNYTINFHRKLHVRRSIQKNEENGE